MKIKPKIQKQMVGFRCDKELLAILKKLAKEKKTTVSNLIDQLLWNSLMNMGEK